MTTVFLFVLALSPLFPSAFPSPSRSGCPDPDDPPFADDSLASLGPEGLARPTRQYALLSIPFFILAGNFLTTGGVARRMIGFAIACLGHLRGGLAIASVFACMLFAAVSGCSPATVVAVGTLVIAGMVRVGYSQEFARRRDRQCRYARHPHPAVDRHGGLRRPRPRARSAPCSSPDRCPASVLGLPLMVAIYVAPAL